MNKHHDLTGSGPDQQITLRGPGELADALPYMMGFHPTDSIVLVALHGSNGRFGGRLRLGIPRSPREWEPVAAQLAECLIRGSGRRGPRPDGILVFLCQDPVGDETGDRVMERLRPLAQRLRTACGGLDVPVYEALCISDGRFWSYCCPDARCCPTDGTPLALPGTSVMAAAAAYAGVRVRGSLRDMERRFAPPPGPAAEDQVRALDAAGAALTSRILEAQGRQGVADETVALARLLLERMAQAPRTDGDAAADAEDDRLVSDDEAAAVILGLQDRETRDRAAQWMEGRKRLRPCVSGVSCRGGAPRLTRSTPPPPSPSPGGCPGPSATSPAHGWLWGSPCGRTLNTSSRACCTRRATKGWIRKRCAVACGVSGTSRRRCRRHPVPMITGPRPGGGPARGSSGRPPPSPTGPARTGRTPGAVPRPAAPATEQRPLVRVHVPHAAAGSAVPGADGDRSAGAGACAMAGGCAVQRHSATDGRHSTVFHGRLQAAQRLEGGRDPASVNAREGCGRRTAAGLGGPLPSGNTRAAAGGLHLGGVNRWRPTSGAGPKTIGRRRRRLCLSSGRRL